MKNITLTLCWDMPLLTSYKIFFKSIKSMNKITNPCFFKSPAVELAQKLIGMKLVHKKADGTTEQHTITITEAYCGEQDKASHSHKGRTKRTEIMYADGGYVYVYLIYGMHWLFNIVANEKEKPEAVLICGLDNIEGSGRVGKLLDIDRSFYGESLLTSKRIWLEENKNKLQFKSLPRKGIDYAKEWKDKPLRFESVDFGK